MTEKQIKENIQNAKNQIKYIEHLVTVKQLNWTSAEDMMKVPKNGIAHFTKLLTS